MQIALASSAKSEDIKPIYTEMGEHFSVGLFFFCQSVVVAVNVAVNKPKLLHSISISFPGSFIANGQPFWVWRKAENLTLFFLAENFRRIRFVLCVN